MRTLSASSVVVLTIGMLTSCAIDDLSRQTRDYTRAQQQSIEGAAAKFERRVSQAAELDRGDTRVN